MKTILKLSLFSLLLFACTSNTMEEQKSEEPITSSESEGQDKQNFQKLVKEQAEIIEHKDYNYLSNLEANIQKAIEQFEDENKEEFTKCLLEALTNDNMLIKIGNIELSDSLILSLFDDNISKFEPSRTLKEEVNKNTISEIGEEENTNSLTSRLPQEIIAHVLLLGIDQCMDEYVRILHNVIESLEFINTTSITCKKFYLLKGMLLDRLKKLIHSKLLNKVLCAAALQLHNNIAQILVNSGKVDIDEMNDYQLNPLHQTFRFNNKKLAKFLIKSGANIEAKDKRGNTLLVLSILEGFEKWVKMLLKFNANCLATNAQGYTALEIAEGKSHLSRGNIRQEILRLLQEKVLQIEENKNIEKESQN